MMQVWEKRLSSLLQNPKKGFVALDKQLEVEGWSLGAEHIFGYSEDQAKGKNIVSFLVKDSPQEFQHFCAEIKNGLAYFQKDLTVINREGKIVDVTVSCTPVMDETKIFIGYTLVITESNISEAKLTELKHQAGLIKKTHDAIITENAKGIVESWNKGAEELYGYSAIEMIGKHISIIHPEVSDEAWKKYEEELLNGRKDVKYFGYRKTKAGKEIPVLISASSLLNKNGKVKGIASITRDMTAANSEEALNRQLSAIVHGSNDAIYSCDVKGNILTWNKSAEEIYGYTKAEMVGCNISVLFDEKQNQELKKVLRAINGEENYKQVPTKRINKAGVPVFLSITISSLEDGTGNKLGASIIARNVSELMLAQKSIEQRLEIQEIVNEILASSHYEKNDDLLINTIIGLVQRMPFSVSEKEIAIHYNKKLFQQNNSCLSDECKQNINDFIQNFEGDEPKEYMNKNKYLHIFPVKKDDVEIAHIVFCINNAEKIQEFDYDLIKIICAHLQLILVATHTKNELAKNIAVLQKANAQLESFSYILSHDLKSPLKNIDLLATWIEEDMGEELNEDVAENIKLLKSRVKRLKSTVYAVLEYTKIGKQGSPMEKVIPKDLVESVINGMYIPENVQINTEVVENESIMDRLSFTRVVQNLIENAIKYNDKPNPIIHVRLHRLKQNFSLKVTDNGPGIEKRYHKKIFNVFETLSGKDESESTGIGLSIVKKIADENNAEIKINSKIGQGTEFVVSWTSEYAQP